MERVESIRPVILKLLRNLASSKEVHLYLKRFSEQAPERFAVIKVGGAIVEQELGELASALAFLQQVGLTPIVIHGAGPQLGRALAAAGISAPIRDGLRVTSPEALAIVRKVLRQENLRLLEALQSQGVRAAGVAAGVFEAEYLDRERYGQVGRVRAVHLEAVTAAVRSGSIPVLPSLGETADGQILNVNADVAARAMAEAIRPYKIVFLTESGGILDGDGRRIEVINLATDRERIFAAPWLDGGMRLKLQEVAQLLDVLPATSSVSITRPSQLAQELFTHRGSGTLVRRGEAIDVYSNWDGVDQARLCSLLESSFGRNLVGNYLESLDLLRLYVSQNYRAALILTREFGVPYLDKFAVAEDAQGEGLGRTAWRMMREENPRLLWRARANHPVHGFYVDQCDGFVRCGKWNVYWYGFEDPAQILPAAGQLASRPASFRE